jgi:hypothetical protein
MRLTLAVAPLRQNNAIPVVGTLATTVHDHLETGYAIFQLDAHAQTFQNFRRSLAQDSHRIFAVDFITWMHHSVGQPAVIGKQQQAAGIEVQATDGNPASALQPGQLGKYAGGDRQGRPLETISPSGL